MEARPSASFCCSAIRRAGNTNLHTKKIYSRRRHGVKVEFLRERRMITETTTLLAPAQVLDEARRFFTGEDSVFAATVVDESDRHVTVATFRSRLAISAWKDEAVVGTRVRVSTLRRQDAVGKFLSWLETASPTE